MIFFFPTKYGSFPLSPASTNSTTRHLVLVRSPGVIPDSLSPTSNSSPSPVDFTSKYLRCSHHHVNLSPLPNHSLCKSQRDLLKNANLIRSYLGLRSLQWLSTTHRKIKIPGKSYEPLSCSYPFLNIPLLSATPVFSSSFSNEPCLSCHWAFAPALPTTILPISTYSSFRSLPNCARWSPFYVFIVIHIFSSQESRLSYDMELFNVWFPPYSVSPMRAGMGSVLCGPSPTTVELFGIY